MLKEFTKNETGGFKGTPGFARRGDIKAEVQWIGGLVDWWIGGKGGAAAPPGRHG